MMEREMNRGDALQHATEADWNGLRRALEDETRNLREFHGALLLQRAAVAANDPEAVQLQTDTITRLLEELERARSRRREILGALTGDAGASLGNMEARLGSSLPAPLRRAREELLAAARGTAQQLSINHSVLRRALESGEAFLKAVFNHLGPETSSYRDPQAASRGSGPAVLVNKVA